MFKTLKEVLTYEYAAQSKRNLCVHLLVSFVKDIGESIFLIIAVLTVYVLFMP